MKDVSFIIAKNEGEMFTDFSYSRWVKEVEAGALIFGIRLGRTYIVRDRICEQYNLPFIRIHIDRP